MFSMRLSKHEIQWLGGSQWRHAKTKRLNEAGAQGEAERALRSTLACHSRRVPAEEQRSGIQWPPVKASRELGSISIEPFEQCH